jgi:hypothetical protein
MLKSSLSARPFALFLFSSSPYFSDSSVPDPALLFQNSYLKAPSRSNKRAPGGPGFCVFKKKSSDVKKKKKRNRLRIAF